MQIPQELPQFKNNPTLLIVSGSFTGRFFLGNNGMLDETECTMISTKEDYSDKEGFFHMKAGSGVETTWSTYEPHKQEFIKKYLKALNTALSECEKKNEFEQVILFAPQYAMNMIEENLPENMKKRLVAKVTGDLVKSHPKEILEAYDAMLKESSEQTA